MEDLLIKFAGAVIAISTLQFIKFLWNKMFGKAQQDAEEEAIEPNTDIK